MHCTFEFLTLSWNWCSRASSPFVSCSFTCTHFQVWRTTIFMYQSCSILWNSVSELACLLPTPWRGVLEKLTGSQLIKFPAFYGTQRFFTTFTSANHPIPPHPTYWRSIWILFSHLCLGHPSGFFASGFPTYTLYTLLLSPICTIYPAHLILDLITWTMLVEEYRSLSSSWSSFLLSPVTSSLLGQNVLNTLSSTNISLCSSLSVSSQVSHPYKTNWQNYSSINLDPCIFG